MRRKSIVAVATERGWKMECAVVHIKMVAPYGAKAGFCDGHH
jgi:hypothetical protein